MKKLKTCLGILCLLPFRAGGPSQFIGANFFMRYDPSLMIGEKFNRLTVISVAEPGKKNRTRYNCLCECGKTTVQFGTILRTNRIKSCGCIIFETRDGKSTEYRHEFDAWKAMIRRCYVETEKAYKNYGGRGITVCDRWLNSFENFLLDMGERPSSEYSLDRDDNEGNYTPSNCKWATRTEQNNNKRTNVILTHNGKSMTISQWAEELGCSHAKLNNRLNNLKWSVSDTLTK